MLIKYFLNLATRGSTDYTDKRIRSRVGYTAGLVGLFINLLLSILKFITGIITSSIAVTADAFNNLSDAASFIVTIIGLKFSNTPPDKDHPYGHGRLEYLTALIIALMVIVVGFQFIRSSFNRIINPKLIKFDIVSFILLVISVFLKIWLSFFNRKLGDKISSSALKATATDALGDVIITSVVALSLLLSLVTRYPIDGYVGILVSVFVLYSGFSLIKENVSQLIGETPDAELKEAITEGVLSYDYILGVHDLMIHSYGPGKTIVTLDAEVPADMDIVDIHNTIDQAERELSKKYNLRLVIHIDPIGFYSKEAMEIMNKIKEEIRKYNFIKSIHDFNLVGQNKNRYIIFDVMIDGNKINKKFREDKLKKELIEIVKGINPDLDCNITIIIEY